MNFQHVKISPKDQYKNQSVEDVENVAKLDNSVKLVRDGLDVSILNNGVQILFLTWVIVRILIVETINWLFKPCLWTLNFTLSTTKRDTKGRTRWIT